MAHPGRTSRLKYAPSGSGPPDSVSCTTTLPGPGVGVGVGVVVGGVGVGFDTIVPLPFAARSSAALKPRRLAQTPSRPPVSLDGAESTMSILLAAGSGEPSAQTFTRKRVPEAVESASIRNRYQTPADAATPRSRAPPDKGALTPVSQK